MLWIDDPVVLFQVDKLKYYIPGPHLSWEEQANALVRFFIYLSLILYLYYANPMILIVPPLLVMAIEYYYHQQGRLSQLMLYLFEGQLDEMNQATNLASLNSNQTQFQTQSKETFSQPLHIRAPYFEDAKKYTGIVTAPVADGEYIGRENLPQTPPGIECKVPTDDNPFGNAMPFDIIEKQINPVCPDEYAKDQKFYNKLFNNMDDLYDRNNSQREFTTNPSSTRVNDQEAAIQFFYNTPYTEQ